MSQARAIFRSRSTLCGEMPGTADSEYLSDGIPMSIANRLAKLDGLGVRPNSLTQKYRGKSAKFQRVGRSLGVDAVLAGRIARCGNSLAIDVELDDVQDDIAKEVSQRLRARLSADDQRRMARADLSLCAAAARTRRTRFP
jgi:TolB-like protein